MSTPVCIVKREIPAMIADTINWRRIIFSGASQDTPYHVAADSSTGHLVRSCTPLAKHFLLPANATD
jgi:hypothetical protein